MDLSILLFQEKGCWVAQCLEYDIAAQAATIDDVVYEFQRVLCSDIAIRNELKLPSIEAELPPAPEAYWRQYKNAARLEKTIPRLLVPSVSVGTQHTELRVAA